MAFNQAIPAFAYARLGHDRYGTGTAFDRIPEILGMRIKIIDKWAVEAYNLLCVNRKHYDLHMGKRTELND